jgi:hypothetical protein
MAFIGNTVQTQGFTPQIDYFNGNGSTVTFTLSRPVVSVAQMIVAVDNVIQNPSSAYTVSGSSITFTSAPLSGTNNIWVEYTSLITTYAALSQSPSVVGDITASGGYLAVGNFGASFVDGTIVDYVTGNGRITAGPADGITLYNGGTSARTALAAWDASGNLTNTGSIGSPAATALTLKSAGTTAVTISTAQSTTLNSAASTAPLITQINGTEALRVDSSGNLIGNALTSSVFSMGVNTTGKDARFGVLSGGNGRVEFYSAGAEAMRIDTSGNALIGQTSQSGTERLGVTKSVAGGWVGYFLNSSNTSGDGGIRSNLGSNCNNTSSYHFNGLTTGINNWYLYGNGTSSFSSDSRLKKNIETTRNGYLDDVMKLRVVKYNWKNDSEGTPRELGLIAQEVEQVFAGLVQDDPNKISEDDDTVYKQLKASVLPMILLKAIQELNAKVIALEAKLEAK